MHRPANDWRRAGCHHPGCAIGVFLWIEQQRCTYSYDTEGYDKDVCQSLYIVLLAFGQPNVYVTPPSVTLEAAAFSVPSRLKLSLNFTGSGTLAQPSVGSSVKSVVKEFSPGATAIRARL